MYGLPPFHWLAGCPRWTWTYTITWRTSRYTSLNTTWKQHRYYGQNPRLVEHFEWYGTHDYQIWTASGMYIQMDLFGMDAVYVQYMGCCFMLRIWLFDESSGCVLSKYNKHVRINFTRAPGTVVGLLVDQILTNTNIHAHKIAYTEMKRRRHTEDRPPVDACCIWMLWLWTVYYFVQFE